MEENDPNILHGPKIPLDIPKMALGQVLYSKLRSHNPYDVLMCEAESGRTVAPPEFLSRSVKVAEGLRGRGLVAGDVVCVMAKAGIDAYTAATGTLFEGGIVFPLDHTLASEVFRVILKTTKPRFVFCDADVREEVEEVLSDLGNDAPIILLNQGPIHSVANVHKSCLQQAKRLVTKRNTLHRILQSYECLEDFIKIKVNTRNYEPAFYLNPENEAAFMVCSSGTMGIPKPVVLTNANLLYEIATWSFLSSFNKILSCPAITFSFFFWISGVLLYLVGISLGFEMTIVQKLEAAHVLRVIDRHKPVWGMFSPALLKFLTLHPDFKTYNVSSLAFMVTGGCSLEKPLVEKIKECWGNHVVCRQSYGLTEVGGSATTSSTEDDILSVGRLLPFFKMKVIDTLSGRTLGPGQKGEIYLTSPSVMKGYMNNEEATAAVLDKNNWFKTGDYGYYTEKGLIYICGRIKDFIKYKNFLISPVELEEIILGIPGVLDAGVAGVEVEEDNFVPMALVVKVKGCGLREEDILKYVNEKVEDGKEVRGGVRFVDVIPRTPSGKMKRNELLNMAKTLFEEE